jgi:hypothetical protein
MHELTTGVLCTGLDRQPSPNCKSKLWSGLDKQLLTLVLKFQQYISINSGWGRTE